MPPAARITDLTAHAGVISGPGVSTVLIGGLPAAVSGNPALTFHVCLVPTHPPSAFPHGSLTVLIGGFPALRFGDVTGCSAPIIGGAPNVLIGG